MFVVIIFYLSKRINILTERRKIWTGRLNKNINKKRFPNEN